MISKRSNTASAKGRDALCVPVQKVKDMEEVSDNVRVPDGTGLSSATPIEPVPVSPVPASIPSAVRTALLAVVDAIRDYLPPDGISQHECLSRVIGATDNPEINPFIRDMERR